MSESMPYLGRCKEKGCEFALFATAEQINHVEDWRQVKIGAAQRVGHYGVFSRCPDRHKVFQLKQIKGTYSKDHQCDSRCLNAKGHTCKCSCGGMNHGMGFAVTAHAVIDPYLITERQRDYIKRLLDERVLPAKDGVSGEVRRMIALARLEMFTKREASVTIDYLQQCPRKDA
jgi:hypothetical protein